MARLTMAMGSWENAEKMVRKCWENEDYLEIEWAYAEKIGMLGISMNFMGFGGDIMWIEFTGTSTGNQGISHGFM